MLPYIAKRMARALLTLFVILTLLFILLRAMPIEGYFENYDKMSPAQIQVRLQALGLTDPLPRQLLRFYRQLLRGDLGTSSVYRKGVSINAILAEKAPVSLTLGLAALGVSLTAGLSLGILMAKSAPAPLPVWDRLGTAFIVLVQAVPPAVCHILLQFGLSQYAHLPMLFREGEAASLLLPVLSLSLAPTAYYAMWLRRYMVDEGSRDYVRLARAKGVSEGLIARRHIFRNAVVPLVQYIPGAILSTVMGSLYVESLYSIPGMGGLLVTAVKRQDNTLVQALVLVYAVISILGLLLGDILMAIADPRITFSKKEGVR